MNQEIGKSILRYALMLSIAYQLYAVVNGWMTLGFDTTTQLNITITLMMVGMLVRLKKINNIQWIAFIYQLMCLGGFVYFWINFGGIYGSVPYFICVFMAFIIIVSRGIFLVLSLILYGSIFTTLVINPDLIQINSLNHSPVDRLTRDIDYVLIGIILILFFVYLKNQFLHYKSEVIRKNQELHKLAAQLFDQSEKLTHQQKEIQIINDNLESIIQEHTSAIEKKHEELSEYAFINAHMLRAPLCRISGLATLMEMENSVQLDMITNVKKISSEIDTIICKINDSVT